MVIDIHEKADYTNVIDTFLNVSEAVKTRTAIIGRAVIQWKHYATNNLTLVLLCPFLEDITQQGIDICVGAVQTTDVSVRVPIALFETGSLSDIRSWVTKQNNYREMDIQIQEDEQRAKEIATLKHLMHKYPMENWQ